MRIVSAQTRRQERTLGGYLAHLRWLAQHTAMIRILARTELRLSVARSRLHYFWWVLDPVLQTMLYAVLFTVIRAIHAEQKGVPIIAFLLAGMIPWRPTVGCWTSVGSIWVSNRALIEQLRFPYMVLLFSKFLTEFAMYMFAFVVLVVLCMVVGVSPKWTWMLLPLWVVVHGLVTIAVMPIFAIVSAFSTDVLKFLPYVLQLIFFGSPILYSIDMMPQWVRPWLYLNPLTMLIRTYRDLLLLGHWPDPLGVTVYVAAMLVLLVVTTYLFVRFGSAMSRSVSRIY